MRPEFVVPQLPGLKEHQRAKPSGKKVKGIMNITCNMLKHKVNQMNSELGEKPPSVF